MKNPLSSKIFNVKIKWMRMLNQTDQQYLERRMTMKHLSLFNLHTVRKDIDYTDNSQLERDLAIYLMMIMIMNAVSDEEPLHEEVSNYGHVPSYLLKISEGVDPYAIHFDTFELSKKIGQKLNLEFLYNKALKAQETSLKTGVSKEDYEMFGEIVDYYALETIGFALIERRPVSAFDYEAELAGTFKYLSDKYYINSKGKTDLEQKYQRIMKEFVTRCLQRSKLVAS